MFLLVIHVDVQGTGTERYTGEILDLGRLSGGEEHRLSLVFGKDLDDLSHLIFETDFQYTIRFVDDERFDILEHESLGILQVIQQSSWSGNDQVDAFRQLLRFGSSVGTADDDTVGLGVMFHELAGNTEDLKSQLSRW
jgi:hypothetical protein